MTLFESYFSELDAEIRHFAAGCDDDEISDQALILCDQLMGGIVTLEGAELELSRLRGDD